MGALLFTHELTIHEIPMKRLADDIEQLSGFPPDAVNTYFAEGILFDSGMRSRGPGILRQLAGRPVVTHALTHGHGDHQGSSARVCQTLGIPLVCGAREADAIAAGDVRSLCPPRIVAQFVARNMAGPACPVARRLVEGDMVGDFRVIDVPGHSPGHVAYWRERDRVLILGDVLTNISLVTFQTGLHQPPGIFTVNPAQNRQSARRLLDLGIEPALVCFGHGPPLRDPRRFTDFLRKLPD